MNGISGMTGMSWGSWMSEMSGMNEMSGMSWINWLSKISELSGMSGIRVTFDRNTFISPKGFGNLLYSNCLGQDRTIQEFARPEMFYCSVIAIASFSCPIAQKRSF